MTKGYLHKKYDTLISFEKTDTSSILTSKNIMIYLLKFTPLHTFWLGHESVIMFFVLSGFVLSLPFLKGPVSYVDFIIKRIFRIYFVYWAAIIFALSLRVFVYHGNPPILTQWFNLTWDHKYNLRLLIDHFIMIGCFDAGAFINAIWSLIHEVRISFVFPLIMIAVVKLNTKTILLLSALIVGISYYLIGANISYTLSTYIWTIYYIPMFMAGAMLAKSSDLIISSFSKLNTVAKVLIFSLSIILYNYRYSAFQKKSLMHNQLLHDYIPFLGVVIIVCFCIYKSQFITNRITLYLGNISYSMYLLHMPVVLYLIYILHGVIPHFAILLLSFILVLILSTISYKLIEVPFISLGKRVIYRLHNT